MFLCKVKADMTAIALQPGEEIAGRFITYHEAVYVENRKSFDTLLVLFNVTGGYVYLAMGKRHLPDLLAAAGDSNGKLIGVKCIAPGVYEYRKIDPKDMTDVRKLAQFALSQYKNADAAIVVD
jgi:hypothetical protein